jgi:uncharacterized protein
MSADKPFRVLSLDGGGMRGTYTAAYLSCVAAAFAKARDIPAIDIGKAFDLIVGTSTGGIIGCALAADVSLLDVIDLYRKHGPAIFPQRLPTGILGVIAQHWSRPRALQLGAEALRRALEDCLGNETILGVYERRGIALAITAVEMGQHRSWVFKTPHLSSSNGRDNHYRLVDVCLATSAAPVYRSMAAIERPDGPGLNIFVDGGLWANNPVLVGLVDALGMTEAEQRIEIYCLGTCPLPAGEQVPRNAIARGLVDWRFGGAAAGLAIDAQEFAYDHVARMLAKHVDRDCEIVRFPRERVPAALAQYLEMDDTRAEAVDALVNQARSDADMTNSYCADPYSREGRLIKQLFSDAPQAALARRSGR